MYFLFSVVSSFIRCPHVQYTIPALQCVRHALHCDFGSTSTISHSFSVPSSHNRIFGLFAERIERTMLLEITLKCFSLRGDYRSAESSCEREYHVIVSPSHLAHRRC